MMSFEPIFLVKSNQMASVTLNHPETLSALAGESPTCCPGC